MASLKRSGLGQFAALVDSDDSDDSKSSTSSTDFNAPPASINNGSGDGSGVDIPVYEDLSSSRADEETVLECIYGDDYEKEAGPWGQTIVKIKGKHISSSFDNTAAGTAAKHPLQPQGPPQQVHGQ